MTSKDEARIATFKKMLALPPDQRPTEFFKIKKLLIQIRPLPASVAKEAENLSLCA